MAIERNLGFEPTDREFEKLGYDIESRVPGTGKLRFIEVKGRVTGAETITVTRNEILYSLNKPDDFILAIVEFLGRRFAPRSLHSSAVPARAGLRGDERELRNGHPAGPVGGAIMSQSPKKTSRKTAIQRGEAESPLQAEFDEVLALIDAAKARAFAAVNTTLIELYWQLGEYISHKIAAATWGQRTVGVLAEYIQRRHPGRSGLLSTATCGGCNSFSRPTAVHQNSHHWCSNCPGPTTCSS